MKTIYLVWNYLQWGGAQIYFLSIVRQAPKDFKFVLVIPRQTNADILKFFEPYNVEFEFFDSVLDISGAQGISGKIKRQKRRVVSELETYHFFAKKNLENSLIHIESAAWQSWVLLSKLAKRTNVVVTFHNAVPQNSVWREKVWSKRLNFLLAYETFQIFSANQNTIDNFKKRINEKFWSKLKLVRACISSKEIKTVSDAKFDREKLLEKHNLPTDKFIVLCVGQFVDRKGRWVFLESAQQIIKKHSDIIFVWLMPNLPTENEKAKIESYGLENKFFTVKSADVGSERFEVLTFFRIADIFALPSFIEGLPITLLEAMALGKCSISTNINAIPEAIKNSETGILIESGNSRELSEAILRLKNNPGLKEKLAQNGKKFVHANFDEAYWAKIALDEYGKCLQR